ncbi:MAG: TonB-dependent receptor domain-containing protein [Vicingaceae bacterium]
MLVKIKHITGLYFLFSFLLPQFLLAQKDTINISLFKVTASKPLESYKTTTLDSVSIYNANNLSELLNNNSVIFIKSYGLGSLATASFRGTGASHTKVQWNGININSPMNGQIDFSLYPTFFFNNAEIHHGASGLIDGNGALGGSVIMSNNEVYERGYSSSLIQSIGSYGAYTTGLKTAYSNKKWFVENKIYNNVSDNNFEFTNVSDVNSSKEVQENADLKQWGIQQAVYREFKSSSLGARFWYFNSDRNLPHTMLVNENNENQTDESFRTYIEWKGLIRKTQFKVSSGLIKNNLNYNNVLANIHSKNTSYLSDNNINNTTYLNNNIKITSNANIKYEIARADGYQKEYSRLNYSWLLGVSKKIKRLNVDLYNRLILVEKEMQPIAPTLGIRFKLLRKERLFVKANTGINYNYPTFNDLYWNPGGNQNLKPEEAKMSEFGLNYIKELKTLTINTEITTFYSKVNDWIIWLPTQYGYWSPNNLKEVENKGIESSLTLSKSFNKLKIKNKLSYAYTKSTNKKSKNNTDNSLNKQLIYVPLHKLNYMLLINYKSFGINYNYNYTSSRFTTSDNNWYLPANFISNIAINKRFKINSKADATGSFSINNLLNQQYQSIAWRGMPGRNYLFSFRLNFN